MPKDTPKRQDAFPAPIEVLDNPYIRRLVFQRRDLLRTPRCRYVEARPTPGRQRSHLPRQSMLKSQSIHVKAQKRKRQPLFDLASGARHARTLPTRTHNTVDTTSNTLATVQATPIEVRSVTKLSTALPLKKPAQVTSELTNNMLEHLYLVRETKSTMNKGKLRESERHKIHCGEAHFNALGADFKVVVRAEDV